MGFSVSMPIIPLYIQDLGIQDPAALKFWAGIIQSSAAVTMAFFAPVWGVLADQYGRRLMLLRAMFGGTVIVALMALVMHPWQLLVLRTLQGCITGTVAAATVLTAGIVPKRHVAFALGLLQTGISIGNSAGPLFGGIVSDFLGRRAVFLITSLFLLTAAFIILFGVLDDRRHFERKPGVRLRFIPDFSAVFSSPVLLSLFAVTFAVQVSNSAANPIMPLFIQELVPASSAIGTVTGLVLGVGAASTAVASLLIGRYSGRVGYGRTLILCMSAGALFTFPQSLVHNPGQLALLRALSLFFIGGAVPVVNALIANTADTDKQGSVYGLNTSIASGGSALGPLIGSTAAAFLGYRAVFIVIAFILASSALGTFRRKAV